jgi:hypothetical protein
MEKSMVPNKKISCIGRKPELSSGMDWKNIVADLRKRNLTLEQIKDGAGFASRGHVHDIAAGKQRSVKWEIGDALLKLHKRVMRRKVGL